MSFPGSLDAHSKTFIGHNAKALLDINFLIGHLTAQCLEASLIGLDQTRDHFDQSTLSRPIRTNKSRYISFFHIKRYIIHFK